MANIKQQKRRIRISERQRIENLRYSSTIKTLFRNLQLHVDAGNAEEAQATHKKLVRMLDRAVARNVLHRNTAARRKARAARMLKQEPKADTATVRRTRKKATGKRTPKGAKAKAAAKDEAPKDEAPKAEAPKDEPAAEEAPATTAEESTPEESGDDKE